MSPVKIIYLIAAIVAVAMPPNARAESECEPAAKLVSFLKEREYDTAFVVTALSNPPENKSARLRLEGLAQNAIYTEEMADRLIKEGKIKDSDRQELLSTGRRMSFLALKEAGSSIWALGVYTRKKDDHGALVHRQMIFPDEGRSGSPLVMGDEACVHMVLREIKFVSRYMTAIEIIGHNEKADCAAMRGVSFPCSGLSAHLAAARNDGEIVYMIAKQANAKGETQENYLVVTASKRGGRMLHVSNEGTSLLINRFFVSN